MAGAPVPGGETGSCAYDYSLRTIAEHADFALDGTIVAIGRAQSTKPGLGDAAGLVGVTLEVHLVEIRGRHREVGAEIAMAPVVFIHPMPGEDEEVIRELVAEHKTTAPGDCESDEKLTGASGVTH